MSNKPKRTRSNNPHKNKIIGLIALGVIVVGFMMYREYQNQQARAIFAPIVEMLNATQTPTPSPTAIDNPDATPVCFWNWATDDVSLEHVEALHKVLDSIGYTDYDLKTSAYGEDKICQRGDEIVSTEFYMMDITPTITLTVDSATLTDSTELGAHIRQIILAIQADDTLPKIGRLDITFVDESESLRWSARYDEVTQAIDDEITDDDLYVMGVQ
jgi:hypothetical protein